MAWFPVDPLSVTAEWLSDVLGGEVRECRLEQIGVGVGLLGRLYRAHLQGGAIPKSVVVKLPTLDLRARSALCEDLGFYQTEVRFYQEIGLADPLPPARPYYAEFDPETHDFVLVLEDLIGLRVNDQTVGCSPQDAATVIDAIAEHHAFWWDSPRFATLPWLRTFDSDPVPAVVARNFEAAWPTVIDGLGAALSPAIRDFGERFPSLVGWYCTQIARGPFTFLHGDLRLDQLFFGVEPGDPPLTALDWQVSGIGRGAYDVAYFLSQSLATDTRRSCEPELIDRYLDRLDAHGIDYPAAEFARDYRLSTAWCFTYPVLAAGLVDLANERQRDLIRAMLSGAVAAIDDHDALALHPD